MRKAFGRFGHSELFTVRAMDTPGGGTGRSQISRACGAGEAASVLNEEHVSKGTPTRSVMLVPRKASEGSIRRGPEGTSQGKPRLHPAALRSALDYERFNSSQRKPFRHNHESADVNDPSTANPSRHMKCRKRVDRVELRTTALRCRLKTSIPRVV
jgi:hypothetical protein